jgi:hypothetical protein
LVISLPYVDFSKISPAPSLSREEYEIVKGYGDWTCFMQSYGLKAWDFDDIDEGKRILGAMVANDKDEAAEAAKKGKK